MLMRSAIVRRPCVALTIPEERQWSLRLDKQEAERRAFASEAVCHVAAMAAEEAAEQVTRRLLAPVFPRRDLRELHVAAFPGYCWIRGFLIGELDADPLVAARVAHARTCAHNRHLRLFRDVEDCGGETGWL
jgi:hypothetical protein